MTPSITKRAPRMLRLQNWVEERQASLLLVMVLLVVAGLACGINLGGFPRHEALEGTLTAQAWTLGNLANPTSSGLEYIRPSLGWLQIAGWTELSGAFQRYDSAVIAGREAMVVAHLVAVPLLWVLARRLGLSRVFAAVAVALYALSPLALQTHRTVALANVATPWLIGAWWLALTPRRQSLAFAGSAGCLAIAALSQPSYLLFLPFLGWSMWRTAATGSRALRLSLAAVVLAATGIGSAVLTRLAGGALLSGPLSVQSVMGQMNMAGATGWELQEGTGPATALAQVDPWLAIVAPLGALICLSRPTLRPLSTALFAWMLLLLTPLGLAATSIYAMTAVAVLLSAGGAGILCHRGLGAGTTVRPVRPVALVTALGLLAASATLLWGGQLAGVVRTDGDQPLAQAQGWIEDNVARDSRLITGSENWVDLLRAGFAVDRVVSASTSFPLMEPFDAPRAWRAFDYVILTESARQTPSPLATEALANSQLVAAFGEADHAVSIHQILPKGLATARERERNDVVERRAAGAQLVRNPSLRMSTPVRALVADGQLDPRALVLLPRAATTGTLRLDSLPEVSGEAGNGRPRRQVLISGRDGTFLTAEEGEQLARTFTEQNEKYRPATVTPVAGSLLLTWSVDYPTGLFG